MKYRAWHRLLSAFVALSLVVGLSPAPALAAGAAAGGEAGDSADASAIKLTLTSADEGSESTGIDLADARISLDRSSYAYTGEPVDLKAYVYYDDEEELNPSCYEFVYYTWDDDECDYKAINTVPTEVGEYYVAARGVGECTGETGLESIRILDGTDLDEAFLYLNCSGYADTGQPVLLEIDKVTLFDEEVPADKYQLVYYSENGEGDLVEFEGTPSKPGNYCVSVRGCNGYSGESYKEYFTIYSANDISWTDAYRAYLTDCSFYAGDVPEDLGVRIYPVSEDGDEDRENALVEGRDFTVSYQMLDEENGEWVAAPALDKAGPGCYLAIAEGISPYCGTAYVTTFDILDPNDLGNANIDSSSALVDEGQGATPSWQVELCGKKLVQGEDYEVAYYAYDDEDGIADEASPTPLAIGEYHAVFTPVEGTAYTGLKTYYVTVLNAKSLRLAEFSLGEGPYVASGEPVELEITRAEAHNGASLVFGKDYELAFYDDDDERLLSAPSEPGEYYVRLVPVAGSEYVDSSWSYWFTVIAANDLSLASISPDQFVVPTEAGKMTPEFSVKMEDKQLKAGTDYEVTYYQGFYDEWGNLECDYETVVDAPLGAGVYEARFSAVDGGAYCGSQWTSFTVLSANDISNTSRFRAWMSDNDFYLGNIPDGFGARVYPVSEDGEPLWDEALVEGTDFSVSYSWYNDEQEEWIPVSSLDEAGPGWCRAIVEGIAPYSGTVSLDFDIHDPNDFYAASAWLSKSPVDEGQGVNPAWTVELAGNKLVEGEDYEVAYYAIDAEGEEADEQSPTPLTVGRYHAIFTPAAGTSYTGTLDEDFTVDTKYSLDLASFSLDKDRYVETGKPVELEIDSVTAADGTDLTLGKDYELAYMDEDDNVLPGAPTEAGTYWAIVKPAEGSKYQGEGRLSEMFQILSPNDLSLASFSIDDMYIATGSPVELRINKAQAYDGKDLTLERDFKLVFCNDEYEELPSAPTDPGEYQVRIIATEDGSYTGSAGYYCFNIFDEHDISNYDLYDARLSTYSFNMGELPDDFGLQVYRIDEYGDDLAQLVEGKDYGVSYRKWDEETDDYLPVEAFDGSVAGEYLAVAEGNSPYFGTASRYFYVRDPHDLNDAYTQLASMPVINKGSTATPVWRVEIGDDELVEGTDYRVDYYKLDDEGNRVGAALTAPLEIGSYEAVFAPVDGSAFHGSTTEICTVYDAKSLRLANFELNTNRYAASDNPIELDIDYARAYDKTDLAIGKDCELAFYGEDGERLSSAPSAPGEYSVCLVPAAGSEYVDSSYREWFEIIPANHLALASISPDHFVVLTESDKVTPEFSVKMGNKELEAGTDYKVTYYRCYDDEWDYDDTPTKTPLGIGLYRVSFKSVTDGAYCGSQVVYVHVYDANDLSSESGYDVKRGPDYRISVTNTDSGAALNAGKDYTVTYEYLTGGEDESDSEWVEEENFDGTRGGDYRAVVRGAGAYHGTRYEYFEIAGPDNHVSIEGATISLSETSFTYDGSAKEPVPTVTLDGKALVAGTDYEVAYANNMNAGTATVTVTGKGNYEDTASTTFAIAKAKVAVPVAKAGLVYNDKAQTGVASGDGYEVTGGSATAAGSYTATATLTDATNHEWADGTTNAKSIPWSIAKASLAKATVALVKKSATYNGKVQKGAVKSVVLVGKTLKSGTDYTVSANSGKSVGSYDVTVTGMGNYTGTASAKFTIGKAKNTVKYAKAKVTKTFKAKDLKKKAKSFYMKPTKAQGKLTYKASMNAKAKKALAFKAGKVTVKKGTKAGTYKVTIKATAAGNANYKSGSVKTTVTVQVK